MEADPDVRVAFDHALPLFQVDLTFWALRARPQSGLDRSDERTYRRVLMINVQEGAKELNPRRVKSTNVIRQS